MNISNLVEEEVSIGAMQYCCAIGALGIFSIDRINQVVKKNWVLREHGLTITCAVSKRQVKLLISIQGTLIVQALTLVVVYNTKENHFIYFIYMLVNDQSVNFMDENIKFELTFDFIMLFVEDFILDFVFSYLFSSREDKNYPDYDHYALALIVYGL
jgi:hypothetical protein